MEFHLICIFYHNDLAMLCVYLTFIAYYSNTFLTAFLRLCTAVQFTYSLLIQTFVNANGRPDMLPRKILKQEVGEKLSVSMLHKALLIL